MKKIAIIITAALALGACGNVRVVADAPLKQAGETTNHHFLKDANNGCVYVERKGNGEILPLVYMNRSQVGCKNPFTVPADRPMFALHGSQEVAK